MLDLFFGWFKPRQKATKSYSNSTRRERSRTDKPCSVRFVGIGHAAAAAVKRENAKEVSDYMEKLRNRV